LIWIAKRRRRKKNEEEQTKPAAIKIRVLQKSNRMKRAHKMHKSISILKLANKKLSLSLILFIFTSKIY
jgi:hypothetical protein